MAFGKGRKRWMAKRRRKRRPPKPPKPVKLPKCSTKGCKRTSEFILRKGDGNFHCACSECLQPMTVALKAKGIDVQIVTRNALDHLRRQGKMPSIMPAPDEPVDVESDACTNLPRGHLNLDGSVKAP